MVTLGESNWFLPVLNFFKFPVEFCSPAAAFRRVVTNSECLVPILVLHNKLYLNRESDSGRSSLLKTLDFGQSWTKLDKNQRSNIC